ncbi:hypothetical protein [Isachenkonia alkalipeptolytica]|uniref:ATPase P n=1 Tax=Isachenkonia alkalipeptolytica TaxID=2565777 RepID=A0AA43XKY3_9CLOT|nr:hypothetical protein [Isachenkonia alkalipeptolytica]NBG88607.1 hypothetical protein [Isachenkonia alkalipeptolytica]
MAIDVKVPWGEKYTINHVVFDLNGTLANNGEIAKTTEKLLKALAQKAKIYVLTADTHNTAGKLKEEIGDFCEIIVLQSSDHSEEKARFVHTLGYRETVTLGNGGNDVKMVQEGILSFGIIAGEGAYAPLLTKVDIVVHNIDHAIEMLIHPRKIVATIRK